MIEDKRFGDLKHFESHFDRFRPQVRQRWREQATNGGGILFDLGSHLIDQALVLFGIPDSITAQCEIMREGSTNVDYFNLVLHYPNQLTTLHADLFSAGLNKRFTLKGTNGSYEKYGLDPQEERLIAGALPNTPEWSDETPKQYGQFYSADNVETIATERGCYQQYFQQIAHAIHINVAPPVKAEDSLWNIKLIELAMESSRLGKTLPVNK
ncbi:Gfo/Idh/MocA family oxidoreductase [Psychromonas sp. KJ10-10]|uniref:Gfo/Idh/MocA family oxidoreductase n=1 Tax=Psychromonas sp. KJ10-10 TaxID=3391823 RepID=UPI0039B6BBDD